VNITRQATVPPGTVILFGSLTSLSRVGLQSYASACINGKRRISGVAKKCEVIPFIPPPLGGYNDPELIWNIVDSCVWLGSIQGYVLYGTAKVLVDLVMDDVEGGGGGQNIWTAQSSCHTHWIAMTGLMSLALAGREFRPSCLPGLRLTKRNT
jgi:hypothetical protein